MITYPGVAQEEKPLKYAAETKLVPCSVSSVSHYVYVKYYLVTVLSSLLLWRSSQPFY